MKRALVSLGALLTTCLLVVILARPAAAADGMIVVFVADYLDVVTYESPSEGCYLLPLGSHVLVNLTDEPVAFYADPLCLGFAPSIAPGIGAHVPPFAGSFKVS